MRQWRGCPAVNPLCPDDLCTLEPRHPKHMHQTFTMIEPREWALPMMKHGTEASELMAEGVREWRRMSSP